MYQEERVLKILENLNLDKKMSINDICQMFNVSEDIARGDILKLIEKGVEINTNSGEGFPVLKGIIKNYEERLELFSEEKRNIAKKALSFIHEKGQYFFDVSTTVSFLAEYLNKSVTVFTHSLDNIEILSHKNDIIVHSLGGCLNMKNRFFYKENFRDYFEGVKFDAVFLGAGAITEDGIYYADRDDAYIKQEVAKRAQKVILLADHKKYQCDGYYKGLNWEQVDIIITDSISTSLFLDILEEQNIHIDPRILIII